MFSITNSALLVIDVQGNLAQRMHKAEHLLERICLCIKAAKIMELPIIYTEQIPAKLGKTTSTVAELLRDIIPIEKTTFSCWENPDFVQKIQSLKRSQIFVVGIEAHVCIFQTVSDLLKANFKVQIVTDAVSSRIEDNKTIALTRMKDLGAILTSSEMMATELMRTAEYKYFKEILSLIK
ncbi:MAG: isochorismatase family protein [Candidatus Omnitrophica bacterium]|nr:isochorismatase family protein [Candidatus Omnitrophota bacterium]